MAAVTGMKGNERQVVAYTSLAHGLNHLMELSYAALLVFLAKEFGVTYLFLGVVANAMALAYGLSAPVGGLFADRIGSKRMMCLELGLSGVAALLIAASTNRWLLATTVTTLGLATGTYHPVGLSFITRTVRARTMAVGYHGMAGSLAVAAAPALTVALAGLWNWRAPFVVYGVVALLGAAAVALSRVQEEHLEEGQRSLGQRAAPPQGLERAAKLAWLPLVAIFCANMVGGFIYRGAITYLPLHLTENLHLKLLGLEPATLGGYAATVALVFGVGGQYLGGLLGERMRREALAVPLAVSVVPFLALMGAVGGIGLVAAASAFAFFNFMSQPVYASLIADYCPPRLQGSAFGIAFLSSSAFGSFAGTFGGYVADRWSTPGIFLALALVQGVTVVAALVLLTSTLGRAREARRARLTAP